MKYSLLALCAAALLCSCTDAKSDVSEEASGSTCTTGKCDNPGQFEVAPLQAIALNDVVSCTVQRDTSTTDEFFQADPITCRYNGAPDPGLGVQIVIIEVIDKDGRYINSHSWRQDDAEPEVTFLVRPSAYPLKHRVRMHWSGAGFGLSGNIDEPRDDLFGSGSYGVEVAVERPAELTEVTFEPALEVWPVVLWPTKELEESWKRGDHTFWYGSLKGNVDVPRGEGFEQAQAGGPSFSFPYQHNLLANASRHDSLTALPQIKLFVPAVPGATSEANLEVQWDGGQDRIKTALTQPGYYLLEQDGQLTPATPEQVRERGARQTTPPPVITTPDMDVDLGDMQSDMGAGDMGVEDMQSDTLPDMPPADPCQGTCSDTQVCVNAACVKQSEQTQHSSCSYDPKKACDTGENADCAEGHACVEGLCRRLSCQTQHSSCSYDPKKICEVNSHCAEGHACAEGLCRRLSCQTQHSSCSYDPKRICDASENADCAEGHACVEGLCRRLSCQTQHSSCSYDPKRACEEDAHCAEDHACNDDNLCQRNTCN